MSPQTEHEVPPEVTAMRDAAAASEDYGLRCLIGGEKVFFVPATRAYLPGHINTAAGMKEYDITRMCEYHFDEAFPPDPDEPPAPPRCEGCLTAYDVGIDDAPAGAIAHAHPGCPKHGEQVDKS